MRRLILSTILLAMLGIGANRISAAETFTNPICSSGADPWVIQHDGFYYRCYASSGNSITVTKSAKLHTIETTVEKAKVWTAPAGTNYSREIWAPELHHADDRWYIYFAADDSVNKNHRMYVLESEGDNPTGPYLFKGKIAPMVDRWAIDGTVLTTGNTSYFIWSGWEGYSGDAQNLYCAKMNTPWSIDTGTLVTRIEAEKATLTNANIRTTASASGGSCVGAIDYSDSKATFTVSAPAAGKYLLRVGFANGSSGWSTHSVTVNGTKQGVIRYPVTAWENWQSSTFVCTLKSGSNTIALGKGDLYAELDYIALYSGTVDRVCISRPTLTWEKNASPIQEGPEILTNGDAVHCVYSASGSWTDNYCLGILTLSGSNPLDSASWTKHAQAVFSKTDTVFGPGHCSFVKSPDSTEDWIVYHAAKSKGSGWSRNVRTQPFTFNTAGFPQFGIPLPAGQALPIPSEAQQTSLIPITSTTHAAHPASRIMAVGGMRLQGIDTRPLIDLRGRSIGTMQGVFPGASGVYLQQGAGAESP